MIHSTEIMIGDIIQSQGEYYKVTDIHEDCFCCSEIPPQKLRSFVFENCDDDADGVPLTPDILEKNGFARALNFSTECYTKRGVDYSIKYRPNDYHVLKVHKPQTCGQTGHCTLTITNCLYLHQIQHALRLCGLNELADNFKVE